VKLLPTGGIDLDTLADYIKAGADGFGIGSPLFNKERIDAGDWGWLEEQCRAFARTCKKPD
jgi:2-dehydro-3-deoxyphosphogluconate aldolase/(4S)-4-hydroxy-2-oxoglutarate aldolase